MENMKILVVAHYQRDGSPCAIFVHDQVKALRAAGNEVRVIVPIAIGKSGLDHKRFFPAVRKCVIDDIPFVFVRYLSASKYGERGFNTKTAIFALRMQMKNVLEDFSPDVIHAHTLGFDTQLGAYFKEITGCPLVVTTHGSDTTIPYLNGEKQYLKRVVEGVDRIIAVSIKLKNFLLDCDVAAPVCVIPNGFNVKLAHTGKSRGFAALAENQNRPLGEQAITINQTGNLIDSKRVDITIRAFAELKKQYLHARLVIVGEGPKKAELIRLTQELDVADSVIFKGQLPNKAALEEMEQAHFFVMPSVNEGFGIVYLEAMASGCIAIGTRGEGIADVITSGVNGFLVEADQFMEVTNTILWCLENTREAAEIARAGSKCALEMTWERNAAANASVYNELLRAKRER